MTEETFSTVAAAVFGMVALFHLVRILLGWAVVIGSWTVPMWVSWVGLIIAGGLSYYGAKFARQ
jgi:hypothetical protein